MRWAPSGPTSSARASTQGHPRLGAVGRAHADLFLDARPVTTIVQAGAFIDPRKLVEIEAEAIVNSEAPS